MKGVIRHIDNYSDGQPRFEINIQLEKENEFPIKIGQRVSTILNIGHENFIAGVRCTNNLGPWMCPNLTDVYHKSKIRLSEVLLKNGFTKNKRVKLEYGNSRNKIALISIQKLPEVWLRGQVENVPFYLQPVAHALIEAKEEVNELMKDFPDELLWEKPAGTASTAFHVQHLSGVLDRLFTYASGKQLSQEQLTALKAEGDPQQTNASAAELVHVFNLQLDKAIEELKEIDEQKLLKSRGVGRAQLPSTVLGLLFHAAEHTMRHLGQLIVTVKVVKNEAM